MKEALKGKKTEARGDQSEENNKADAAGRTIDGLDLAADSSEFESIEGNFSGTADSSGFASIDGSFENGGFALSICSIWSN
ncbi:MAG: hypothetical protein LBJ64_10060 [Deltaproteobacteria bacterium]|nr:hypothetical protein [Deltaproteobacteria bacterium]